MTIKHIPPEEVLDGAKEESLLEVVVIGWREDGTIYGASSTGWTDEIRELFREAERRILAKSRVLR